jgi:hypothetical protein
MTRKPSPTTTTTTTNSRSQDPLPPRASWSCADVNQPFLPNQSGTTLYRQFAESHTLTSASSPAAPDLPRQATAFDAANYTAPFLKFLQDNPTVFHTVQGIAKDFKDSGFKKLSEQDAWDLNAGGKYYVERNGSSLIAFVVGKDYVPGGGAAIIAGHIDALTVRGTYLPSNLLLRTSTNKSPSQAHPQTTNKGGLCPTWCCPIRRRTQLNMVGP